MRRIVTFDAVRSAVRDLCIQASRKLPVDVSQRIRELIESEKSPAGRSTLEYCLRNAAVAEDEGRPLCQDTGFAVYFVAIGSDLHVEGGTITDAIQQGTAAGYREGYLRKSLVRDPLFDRTNTGDNTPAIIHLTIVPGDGLDIILAPKGGGSENMSRIAMLTPSDGADAIRRFVVDTVVQAGANPCPPVVVGVGIGGTFEYAAFLAKRALVRKIGESHADPRYAGLERELLDEINRSGVGPQGLGGTTTALAVQIETFPCHIASLPVAVNLNCHVARHAHVSL